VRDFKRVGPEVDCSQSQLVVADVQPLHDITVDELMLAANNPYIAFSDTTDRLRYGFMFRGYDEFETELPDRYVSVALTHESIPDSWRLLININTYTLANRLSSNRINYRVEAMGDDLLQAKKAVFLILGSTQIEGNDSYGPIETITTKRKMYEKPMQPDDCEAVLEMLKRTIKRAAISH